METCTLPECKLPFKALQFEDRKMSPLFSSKLTKELLSTRMHYALHIAVRILGNYQRSKWFLYPQENGEMKWMHMKSLED